MIHSSTTQQPGQPHDDNDNDDDDNDDDDDDDDDRSAWVAVGPRHGGF